MSPLFPSRPWFAPAKGGPAGPVAKPSCCCAPHQSGLTTRLAGNRNARKDRAFCATITSLSHFKREKTKRFSASLAVLKIARLQLSTKNDACMFRMHEGVTVSAQHDDVASDEGEIFVSGVRLHMVPMEEIGSVAGLTPANLIHAGFEKLTDDGWSSSSLPKGMKRPCVPAFAHRHGAFVGAMSAGIGASGPGGELFATSRTRPGCVVRTLLRRRLHSGLALVRTEHNFRKNHGTSSFKRIAASSAMIATKSRQIDERLPLAWRLGW